MKYFFQLLIIMCFFGKLAASSQEQGWDLRRIGNEAPAAAKDYLQKILDNFEIIKSHDPDDAAEDFCNIVLTAAIVYSGLTPSTYLAGYTLNSHICDEFGELFEGTPSSTSSHPEKEPKTKAAVFSSDLTEDLCKLWKFKVELLSTAAISHEDLMKAIADTASVETSTLTGNKLKLLATIFQSINVIENYHDANEICDQYGDVASEVVDKNSWAQKFIYGIQILSAHNLIKQAPARLSALAVNVCTLFQKLRYPAGARP